jgi:hypothetical protein
MLMNAAQGAPFDTTMRVRGHDRAGAIARVTMVARLLDSAFFIPGINRRVGLDSVIGLVPGIGDAVSAVLASYIVWEARRLGLPRWKIAQMIGHVAIDTAIGAIPLAGDLFDVFYKSNQRNLRIIQEHLGMPKRGPREIDGTVLRRDGQKR